MTKMHYMVDVSFGRAIYTELRQAVNPKNSFHVYIHTGGITDAGDPESCCSGFRIM